MQQDIANVPNEISDADYVNLRAEFYRTDEAINNNGNDAADVKDPETEHSETTADSTGKQDDQADPEAENTEEGEGETEKQDDDEKEDPQEEHSFKVEVKLDDEVVELEVGDERVAKALKKMVSGNDKIVQRLQEAKVELDKAQKVSKEAEAVLQQSKHLTSLPEFEQRLGYWEQIKKDYPDADDKFHKRAVEEIAKIQEENEQAWNSIRDSAINQWRQQLPDLFHKDGQMNLETADSYMKIVTGFGIREADAVNLAYSAPALLRMADEIKRLRGDLGKQESVESKKAKIVPISSKKQSIKVVSRSDGNKRVATGRSDDDYVANRSSYYAR